MGDAKVYMKSSFLVDFVPFNSFNSKLKGIFEQSEMLVLTFVTLVNFKEIDMINSSEEKDQDV